MDSKKKKNLEETYERIINVGLCIVPYEDLSDLAAPEMMLFGTTKDEKVFSFSELDAMFKSQYEQMVGFVPSLDRKRLFTRFSNDGNNAFITEEVTLTISSPEEVNTIFIRASCVMEYIDNQWKLTHWHASTPVDTENDHWHMEEWKREKEKLQKLVDQQTADIQIKNRELEIEAAIERVRAVAMGMTKPEDMLKVCRVISDQLQQFGVEHIRNVQTVIIKEEKGTYHNYQYFTPYDKESFEITECHKNPTVQAMIDRMLESPDAFFTTSLTGEELATFRSYRKKENQFPDPLLDDTKSLDGYFFSIGPGGLGITLYRPLNEEGLEIFKRLHNVFSLAYRRFRDIEKAEAQAWEAKIEAALEKVRSRSMAMHKSDDLHEVVSVLFEKLKDLQIPFTAVGIATRIEGSKDLNAFVCGDNADGLVITNYRLPYFDNPIPKDLYSTHEKQLDYYVGHYSKEEKDSFYEYVLEHTAEFRHLPEDIKRMIFESPAYTITHVAVKNAVFNINDFEGKVLADHEVDIIKRFARVFDQAYTRFLDLQKAEAQAKEAQVEAALERVRSRSLAMHKTDELQEVVRVVAEELKNTGVILDTWGAVICTYFEDSKDVLHWTASEDPANPSVAFLLPYFEDELYDEAWNSKNRGDSYFAKVFSFDVKNAFFKHAFQHSDYRQLPEDYKKLILESESHGIAWAWSKNSAIMIPSIQGDLPSEDEKEILIRFAKVFEQSFIRFLDLQRAEAQTIEATNQASLDRVRGEIASMRSTKDLERITPLVWNELTTLGIPFIRCGVFIIHEEEKEVEVYLSKPDGTSLAVMHLPFGASDLAIQIVDAWQKGSVYTQHWNREDFLNYGRTLIEQGQIPDLETYRGAEEAPESLHLHFIPFNQGMLYVGETELLSDEEINLAVSLAEAFSIAYARYEDFVKLEKAKAGIEEALTELKATQSQLVQQEKLASLGQLTAGIAHEIKNPLNFVNNFSEVSIEMVDEAREEVKRETADGKRQKEDVLTILDDIEANLRKIHEHGSRADGIVKSMLQHSRGGSGKMESTDLNALIKEYVNLAFHGMRAGKDPINVDIDLQLDDSIGEVPLVIEDFSRVILNLCNNAFDAMRDKAKGRGQKAEEFTPKLTVRTKSDNGKVTIEIEDNGPGISDEIKDKIMQPFFTTKKGTQGTGLGLSITNDIVKAHGGTIHIDSIHSEKTVFRISLDKHKS